MASHQLASIFISQLCDHWLAFITGSILMGGLALIERLVKPLPTLVYVVAILLGGVVCASFEAWQGEHEGRIAAEQDNAALKLQINALNQPVITGRVKQVVAGPNADGTMMEILEVYVENAGAPTNLTDWNLSIRNESLHLTAINCVMPEELDLTTHIGLKGRVNRDHMLQELTVRKIDRGDSRIGWLVFTFPGFDPRLVTPGTVFTVTCVDAFGGKHKIERVSQLGTVPITPALALLYSPGSEQLFFLPSPSATASPVPNIHGAHRHRSR